MPICVNCSRETAYPDDEGRCLDCSREADKEKQAAQNELMADSSSQGVVKQIPILLIIACALLGVIAISLIIGLTRGKASESWVYQVQTVDGFALTNYSPRIVSIDDKELDKLGWSGWELCAAIPVTETQFPNFGSEEYHTGIKDNTRTNSVILIFKKRVSG